MTKRKVEKIEDGDERFLERMRDVYSPSTRQTRTALGLVSATLIIFKTQVTASFGLNLPQFNFNISHENTTAILWVTVFYFLVSFFLSAYPEKRLYSQPKYLNLLHRQLSDAIKEIVSNKEIEAVKMLGPIRNDPSSTKPKIIEQLQREYSKLYYARSRLNIIIQSISKIDQKLEVQSHNWPAELNTIYHEYKALARDGEPLATFENTQEAVAVFERLFDEARDLANLVEERLEQLGATNRFVDDQLKIATGVLTFCTIRWDFWFPLIFGAFSLLIVFPSVREFLCRMLPYCVG